MKVLPASYAPSEQAGLPLPVKHYAALTHAVIHADKRTT